MQNRIEEILLKFTESWIKTELFFDDLIAKNPEVQRFKKIRQFIDELKQKGGNNYFRLGNSMDRLLISRSIDLVLRKDQKYIRIDALDSKFNIVLRDGQKSYREYFLDDLGDPKLSRLLVTLKNTLAD